MRRLLSLLTLSTLLQGGPKKQPATTPVVPMPVPPPPAAASAGSVYSQDGRLADLGRDFRARQVGDIVDILVSEQTTASTQGATNQNRKSSASASINSLAGPKAATSLLANLAKMSGAQQLQGQGDTSRSSAMTTTLSCRVIKVMSNGDLMVAGTREVWINSEHQTITIRGIVRANDLSNINKVPSERLADLEVHIDGKGAVQDAVRRPNFLYRLLMGLLPF